MSSIKRGTILSIDTTTWLAMVLLDGADAECQMPVGQWVISGQLSAGVEVACITFDDTNTDDGVVLGPYSPAGAVPVWTLPALNIGSGTGAASGSIVIGGTNPKFAMIQDSGAADNKRFDMLATSTYLVLRAVNDADNSAENGVQIMRSGATVTAVNIPSTHGGLNIGTANGAGAGQVDVSSAYKKSGTQVVAARQTGWTAATNTKTRTTFDTTTVTLAALAAHVGALIDDLISHGLIGA